MLVSFCKYLFFTLAMTFFVSTTGCKRSGGKQQVVPEQKFECATEICREVVQADQCKLKGGLWEERLGKCLSDVEYAKWRCELSGKIWSNETLKCDYTADGDDGEDSDPEEEENEKLVQSDEGLFPEIESPETSVNIKVEIIE